MQVIAETLRGVKLAWIGIIVLLLSEASRSNEQGNIGCMGRGGDERKLKLRERERERE